MKKIFFLLVFLYLGLTAFSQSVSINEDGSAANASAILDVKSTSKGMLVPRVTSAQRQAISNPATGLMVYDTDENTFYFYNGSAWVALTDTTLNEAEVDAFVANNGYLTSEVDGSVTNEIELPDQTGNSGKYLTTDGASPSWENASGGASQLSELSDVATSTATGGNILVADGTSFRSRTISGDAAIWSNGTLIINNNSVDGTDIALGSDADGDLMYYDGSDWARLPAGTANQVLQMDKYGDFPSWKDAGVASDESGLKTIRGEVNSSGTKVYGSGFTSSGSGGSYTITFSSAFSGMPTVVATLKASNHRNSIEVASISISGCTINTIETYNEVLEANGFTFIAIGPE